jgi:RHH-type transcriptional regulator, proline utilization regulon repressor / proline dehydrogenase / delta 1-pyrroline-5-carboxylate dehydrogenase
MPRLTDRLPSPDRPESDTVAQRLASLQGALDWAAAAHVAIPWVQAVRHRPPPFWAMERLLKEYPISSAEGLALMRLAEALLRVPDTATAIALTADQLGRADFDSADHSALARLSSTAIAWSKHWLPAQGHAPNLLSKLGSRTVVTATLRAVQLLGKQFVLGQSIQEGLKAAHLVQSTQPQVRFSFDMLGEGARTQADALRYLAGYQEAIAALAASANPQRHPIDNDGISIKLSALHPRYEDTQHNRVMAELVPRVWSLCDAAAKANLNLTIDAEEVDRLELSLDVFEALLQQVAQHHPGWEGFGMALQAYQTRAVELIEAVVTMARRYGVKMMCRLVKGAYWDAEIKRAQELGLAAYPVFTSKHHTDVSYLACARVLLQAHDVVLPQFATHNAGTIAALLQLASKVVHPLNPQPSRSPVQFELQRLHGMGEGVYREVLQNPRLRCRVYAPVGEHRDLLAYLVRRLLENGANSSFVHQLTDESVGIEDLLTSPLRLEPCSPLPLPLHLYGPQRANSRGRDLAVVDQRKPLQQAYAALLQQGGVAPVAMAQAADAAGAIQKAVAAFGPWNHTPVSERAAVLRRAADAMETQLPQLCALLVAEAHKTWADTVAEVREAVDFLRYYANDAERVMAPQTLPGPTGENNTLRLEGRGAWVCISPWNFPLAIFVGQVAAALVTGNTVVAKPAEQTPAVALEAVKLLHAAGVPSDALQLLHGFGETVGAALVATPQVAGVVFTGSTQVAKIIQRALANKEGPIVPLIGETGGINAMVVDSTALAEQVADAVVQSAFRSAGQRCSALRLLCVQDEVADAMIEMVRGAVQELVTGPAADWATDVGPLIDQEAFETVEHHVQHLKAEALDLLAGAHARQDPTLSHTMLPQMFEVPSVAHVKAEIFGPVLQVVRFKGDPIAVVEQINQLGYGLTLGIQTRIDSRAQALATAARVGNVYVNRNMIGAVVGVQPFGGEGLSGTGPKAGGPHYLLRFCAEQTVTINTTAAGGNVALLSH